MRGEGPALPPDPIAAVTGFAVRDARAAFAENLGNGRKNFVPILQSDAAPDRLAAGGRKHSQGVDDRGRTAERRQPQRLKCLAEAEPAGQQPVKLTGGMQQQLTQPARLPLSQIDGLAIRIRCVMLAGNDCRNILQPGN